MFTLKNVKYMKSLSHETHCYSASLYLDGKKVAEVSNHGYGGPDNQYWVSESAQKAAEAALSQMDTLPTSDRERADIVRQRIRRYADIGDSSYDHCLCGEPDSVLLSEYGHLLTDPFFNASLDIVCCDLVNDWLHTKELKRLMSKRVLFTKPGEPGIYQTQCAKNKTIMQAWSKQLMGEGNLVLNLMPFNEALQKFKEEAR